MKKYISVLILSLLLLTGCGKAQPPAASAPETTIQTHPQPVETTEGETIPETAEAETLPAPEPAASRITEGLHITLGGISQDPALSDGSCYSRVRIPAGTEKVLRISSETPFAALYLSWDTLPGTYTVSWEDGSMTCGGENFYHDYIRLPEAVREVSFELPETTLLCDLFAYTDGAAPEGVQDWLPPCEEADILVFPTHSDDDVLFFGPLIARYVRELRVQTAFMVDHVYQPERTHERLNGLWELGVRHYPILGSAPDSPTHSFQEAMSLYAKSDIPGWQTEQIRRFRPLVVVGHDLDGEYGNGGHKVNAHFLVQSVEGAGDPQWYPESYDAYGPWEVPKFYLHLYEENSLLLDVNTPVEGDGRTPFEIAEDAFRCHKSQQGFLRVRQGEEFPEYDCRPFGLHRTLVGSDTTADIMDNIDPAQWRK